MTENKNKWASCVYDILSKNEKLSEEQKRTVIDLFTLATNTQSIDYRKLWIFAMLKCDFPQYEILSYLSDTVSLFPYKGYVYNHFFTLGDEKMVKRVFLDIIPKIKYFIWSDTVLKRIIKILNPSIVGEDKSFVCSNCKAPFPKSVPLNYYQIINIWMKSNVKGNNAKLINKFNNWLNSIINLNIDYSVIIDGANVGRLVEHRSESLIYEDIEAVIDLLIERGKNPYVVLNEMHKSTYKGDVSRVIWSPRWIDDDICWMALALIKDGCEFVTNDKCANWHHILKSNNYSVNLSIEFKIWFDTFKCDIKYKKRFITVSSSKEYSRIYFFSNNHHHLPINNQKWICWE